MKVETQSLPLGDSLTMEQRSSTLKPKQNGIGMLTNIFRKECQATLFLDGDQRAPVATQNFARMRAGSPQVFCLDFCWTSIACFGKRLAFAIS